MSTLSSKLLVPQRLGFAGLSVLLIVMNMCSALSMDMFSPSLPDMTREFGATETEASLTITVFFIFYSIGMLVFGTLSDKHGRKPMLIVCMSLNIVGSVLCALSTSIPMLVAVRVIQALGGGGAMAIAIALLKDVFTDELREKFLVFMSVMQVIGPIAAPIIGAYIASFSTWQMVFWVLTGVGVFCLVGVLLFNETLPAQKRLTESTLKSYGRMGPILKDKAFTVFLLATVMPNVAFGPFLSISSYIYIDNFGLDATVFGYIMAIVAVFGMIAPILYNLAIKHFTRRTVVFVIIALPLVTAATMLPLGTLNPIVFTITFIPVALSAGSIRPAMTAILLQQNEQDAGSVSGIINFGNVITGAIGMGLGSLFVFNFIFGMGVITLACTVISLVLWLYFSRAHLKLVAFEKEEHPQEQAE